MAGAMAGALAAMRRSYTHYTEWPLRMYLRHKDAYTFITGNAAVIASVGHAEKLALYWSKPEDLLSTTAFGGILGSVLFLTYRAGPVLVPAAMYGYVAREFVSTNREQKTETTGAPTA